MLKILKTGHASISPVMIHGRIIPDFRDPDIIRLGINPLYTTWIGLHKTVMSIREILISGEYLRISGKKKKVTSLNDMEKDKK